MAAFERGPDNVLTSRSFISTYDMIKDQVDEYLALPYGKELLGLRNFMKIFGASKGVSDITYRSYEQDRIHPKIKATNGGAGANGAEVTFTVDSTSRREYDYETPYISTNNFRGFPVREKDVILVKPGSGIVNSGNYIQCVVMSVDKANWQFNAQPVLSTKAIPHITSAEEIIIVGRMDGERSKDPDSLSRTVTKYTNYLSTLREKHMVTGTAQAVAHWFDWHTDAGKERKFGLKGESEAYVHINNLLDLTMLLSENNTNVDQADDSIYTGSNDNPAISTKGLIPEYISRANESNYAGAIGYTIADFEDLAEELNSQDAGDDNLFWMGIRLKGRVDSEMRSEFKSGGISYGTFTMDQEKAVNLQFDKVSVFGSTFGMKTMPAFNKIQHLGASGFGFKNEGFTMPTRMSKIDGGPERGDSAPHVRMRFLQDAKSGESQEMRTEFIDKFKVGDDGEDVRLVRYIAKCGFEGRKLQNCAYAKQTS